MELLLLADPSEEMVAEYTRRGTVLVAKAESGIVGVLVLANTRPKTMEIMNISVNEKFQNTGIGKRLLLSAIDHARENGVKALEIGTGNSSIVQLLLYQKCGFRIIGVDLDYFGKYYEQKITENGIECRDLIRMRMEL